MYRGYSMRNSLIHHDYLIRYMSVFDTTCVDIDTALLQKGCRVSELIQGILRRGCVIPTIHSLTSESCQAENEKKIPHEINMIDRLRLIMCAQLK